MTKAGFVSLLLAACNSLAASAAEFSIVDLGTLPGATSMSPRDINASGQIVGSAATPSGLRGFVWNNGDLRELMPLAGRTTSAASGINNRGDIVGYSGSAVGTSDRAVLWIGGAPTDLGTPSGGLNSRAVAINSSGTIAGTSLLPNIFDPGRTDNRMFVYKDGVMTDTGIGGGPPDTNNNARVGGINDAGIVTGAASDRAASSTLFTYDTNNGRVLQFLGSRPQTFAGGINDAGLFVGSAFLFEYERVAGVVLGGGTPLRLLDPLPGDGSSGALDINNHQMIVGWSATSSTGDSSNARPVLYGPDGTIISLSDLPEVKAAGWDYLVDAVAINDIGQIVGTGYMNGVQKAFVLTIPEPSVYLFILAGLAAVVALVFRRRTT